MDGEQSAVVRLEVPAESGYLRVVRLTASAVGTVVGFDVDRIEDLRIAADELAGAAIAAAVPDATLVVAFRPGVDAIGITGTVPGEGPVVVEPIAEQVLRAIVEDFVVEAGEGRVSFSCVMRRTPR